MTDKKAVADGSPIEVVDMETNQATFVPADELAGQFEGLDLESLPVPIRKRVEALKALEEQRAQVEKEYREEQKKLALKYREKFSPLYANRGDLISGKVQPEGLTEGERAGEKEGEKGIPEFWLQAMKNHPLLQDMIMEDDEQVLKSLVDVRAIDNDDMDGFRLEFVFSPNDFFENEVLSKSYTIPNMMEGGEPILENLEGTEIKWKAGKNITVKEVTRRQKKKSGRNQGASRVVTRMEPVESFFNFFTAPKLPDMEEDMGEDDEEVMNQIDADFGLALLFRDKIVPQAVLWFTGEAEVDEDEDYEFEEGEDEDEDEEGEEDESEEEGEEGAIHPAAAKNPAAGEQAPECKNQ